MKYFLDFHKRLTKIKDSEPLSPLSFILIIFLDIFILVNIFIGLNNQVEQLVSPEEYIPSICRDIIINEKWVEENRINKLSNIILNQYRSYYYSEEDKNPKHPICVKIIERLEQFKKNEKLIELFKDRDKLITKYNSYDSFQKENNSNVITILRRIEFTNNKINNNSEVKKFWEIINEKTKLSKELSSDLRKANFIFPIKRLLIEFLFLIPLLFIFIFWNNKSIKKGRHLQIFISSHLIVVALIPVFFEICHAVFEIIPKKILKTFIEFLESLKLIAIWHYILTIIAILITLFLIYFIQKKVFNKERLIKRRFIKKQCINCGKKINYEIEFCPYCGNNQKIKCKNCNNLTFKGCNYCTNCGSKVDSTK